MCSSRRLNLQISDTKMVFGAALLAGCSFQLIKNTTISLYMFWKLLHILCLLGIEKKWIPSSEVFVIFLYSFSTSVLFHTAVFEPHSLRKSYWKFLNDCSGRRFFFNN